MTVPSWRNVCGSDRKPLRSACRVPTPDRLAWLSGGRFAREGFEPLACGCISQRGREGPRGQRGYTTLPATFRGTASLWEIAPLGGETGEPFLTALRGGAWAALGARIRIDVEKGRSPAGQVVPA